MPTEYLIQFAQTHTEFRLPELHSVCECLDFQIQYDSEKVDLGRPFMVVSLSDEQHARLLGERCVLIKYVYLALYLAFVTDDIKRHIRALDKRRIV